MYNWQATRVNHLSDNLVPVEILTLDLKLIVRHPARWIKNMVTSWWLHLYSVVGSLALTSLKNLLNSVLESLALLVTSSEMWKGEPVRRSAFFQTSSRRANEGKATKTGLLVEFQRLWDRGETWWLKPPEQ